MIAFIADFFLTTFGREKVSLEDELSVKKWKETHSRTTISSLKGPRKWLRTMAECGPRKRKYRRFQVGAFMTMHKQKREEAVRQSEKIIEENVKIAEKKKELRAKKQRLERLETKVIYYMTV